MPLLALRCRDPCARTKERPTGAKGSLQLTARKERDLLVYSCKELDFGNNLNVLGKQILPKGPQQEPSLPAPWFPPFENWAAETIKAAQTSDLHACDMIRLYCFDHWMSGDLSWQCQKTDALLFAGWSFVASFDGTASTHQYLSTAA